MCTDGHGSYASYVAENPQKQIKLYQVSHVKKEYARFVRHFDSNGRSLGVQSMNTCDIDGLWSYIRRQQANEGNVPASCMLGFCVRLQFEHNFKTENKMIRFLRYLD